MERGPHGRLVPDFGAAAPQPNGRGNLWAMHKPPGFSTCMMTHMPAAPGAAMKQQTVQMLKSGDGKMRVDYPNMSVITNPHTQQAMILDHAKQEFKVVPLNMPKPGMPPLPHMPGLPHVPALPSIPGAPHPPVMQVQDLGKAAIQGHPVEGKQVTMAMPTVPGMPQVKPPQMPAMPASLKKLKGFAKLPGMPKLPALPKAPGMPSAPGMPKAPAPPKPPTPTVAEVWTSHVTGMPVMSKMSGEFGQQTMVCQNQPVPEPHPSMFMPPPNYKLAP